MGDTRRRDDRHEGEHGQKPQKREEGDSAGGGRFKPGFAQPEPEVNSEYRRQPCDADYGAPAARFGRKEPRRPPAQFADEPQQSYRQGKQGRHQNQTPNVTTAK